MPAGLGDVGQDIGGLQDRICALKAGGDYLHNLEGAIRFFETEPGHVLEGPPPAHSSTVSTASPASPGSGSGASSPGARPGSPGSGASSPGARPGSGASSPRPLHFRPSAEREPKTPRKPLFQRVLWDSQPPSRKQRRSRARSHSPQTRNSGITADHPLEEEWSRFVRAADTWLVDFLR